jgi:hypothetical protein
MMNRSTMVLWAVVAVVMGGGLAQGAEPEPKSAILGPDRVVVVEEQAWSPFNWASFDQDKIVSWKGYQYTVYWAADRVLTVARRCLESDEVQRVRLEDYVLAAGLPESQQSNGHRNTVLGISPGDGRLHLSWDHHNNDLNYTRSRAGLITEPPERISPADFEPRQPVVPGAPQRVTYPRFFNGPDETLYFFYRSGGSGAGNIALFQYQDASGKWDMISERLFGQEGVYAPWDNSISRNAYMHDLLFDATGRLHVTWVYREAGRTWASNHDLHYVFSDDRGRSWRNNAGQLIADTRQEQHIVLDSPGIVVYEIPVFSWLMNACSMTLDSHNQPHVATYHMAQPFRPDDLQHNPPLDEQHRLNYYHYWRDVQGRWHRSQPLPLPLPRRRPMIIAAPDDTMIIYFATAEGFQAHVARAADRWSDWKTVHLTGPELTVNDASKPDRRLLRDRNILSFTADPHGQEPQRGMAIVDFQLQRLLDAVGQ